jgi:hypothetical protein
MSETERLWALAREAAERDRAGEDVTEATALAREAAERDRAGEDVTEATALGERSVSGLTMTKGVFALCSFAFGFVAVWYFLG